MNGEAFRERVAEAKATELDRLGSEKLLVALTDADLTPERVLSAAAASEHVARETFEAWAGAEREAGDADAAAVFADVAEQEADHYERVVTHLPDADDIGGGTGSEATPGPMHASLRDRGTTIERAAGLVGRGLVSDRTHLQVINFFVNEGNATLADLFRDLRAETGASLERGLDLLEDRCDDEADWETATAVAADTVKHRYDDYADALAGMGLDPKPVC